MVVYDPAKEADKMRALVQLAASIADQLANIASSLAIEAEMLSKATSTKQFPDIAALISRNANHTDAIARSLQRFAGQQPSQPRLLSPAAVLLELTPMFEAMVGPTIDFHVICGANIHTINVDCRLFEQILCTLVARARDAVGDLGEITISVANEPVAALGHMPSHVRIEVADTGLAIDPLQRVFEPAWRRKRHGSWLGLATVYGMVSQMGGCLGVQSGPSGTIFTIVFEQVVTATQ